MDRNGSHEPGYRPQGDCPAPSMTHGDSEYYAVGSRQVLARMPNLAQVDPNVDPIQSYPAVPGMADLPELPENRILGAGVSVKLLAGGAVCLTLLAALGFSFLNRKPASEPSHAANAWQMPAPNADAAPRFEMPGPATTAPSATAASTPWNGTPLAAAPAPWNPATPPAGGLAAGPSNPGSVPEATPWGARPTELTATATSTPWGQLQDATPTAPPSNGNTTVSATSPWTPPASMTMPTAAAPASMGMPTAAPPTSMTMPTLTPPAWANPTPIAGSQFDSLPANSATAPSYQGNYQQAQMAPAYATPYPAASPSMNGSASNPALGASLPTSTLGSPAGVDPAARTTGTTPYDLRNVNSGAASSAPYPAPSYSPPGMGPNPAGTFVGTGPVAPTGTVATANPFTADNRAAVGGSSGTPTFNAAPNANVPASYLSGATPSRSAYPNATLGAPTGMPSNTTPNYPASGYPTPSASATYPTNGYSTTPAPTTYPTNGSGTQSTPFPATGSATYPGAPAPVGAPPVPRYDSGASVATPATGAAQPGGWYR